MTEPRLLRIYLDDGLRQRAETGQHNFIKKIETVVKTAGYRVDYRQNTLSERLKSADRRGYSLFHMDDPFHDRAVTIRRVYQYPFWAIERSAKRWEWRVATARFDPPAGERQEAGRFYNYWQNRLFGDLPGSATRNGFVYVPLQGNLLNQRSFQSCAPLDMLRHVITQDSARKVVASLHPGETYSRAERKELDDLAGKEPRLTVLTGEMEHCLSGCDYVVTQNSAAAFSGYFFGKPAVLFGQIDFHHIAARVDDLGMRVALQNGPDLKPDFAAYIHWFWQIMSINAGHPDAGSKIQAALKQAGWPV